MDERVSVLVKRVRRLENIVLNLRRKSCRFNRRLDRIKISYLIRIPHLSKRLTRYIERLAQMKTGIIRWWERRRREEIRRRRTLSTLYAIDHKVRKMSKITTKFAYLKRGRRVLTVPDRETQMYLLNLAQCKAFKSLDSLYRKIGSGYKVVLLKKSQVNKLKEILKRK